VNKRKAKDISARMIAVIVASVTGTIGVGSILGVETWKSAAIAALMGVAMVAESLARKYLSDGSLTTDEINEAFGQVNKKKEK
jgi:low temperature requirement protein LtrA